MATESYHSRLSEPIRQLIIVIAEGPDAGRSFDIQERCVSIGHSPHNTITLNDPTVSQYHIELECVENGILITDLGSLNGTYVDRLRLERGILPAGSTVKLGGTVLTFSEGAKLDPPQIDDAPLPGLVGESLAMRSVAQAIRRIAATTTSVLLEGETGVGKEVVAAALHRCSARADRDFVVVDCGSLPATLIASELFGHERGAFTGADRRRIGAFERSDGGTLFLDEIGELPPQLQPVLLGALERRKIRRLGGQQDIAVDTRIIAATNRDLRAEVNSGRFRADLYFRLAVTRIAIPPLRERLDDIEQLVSFFTNELVGSTAEVPFGPASIAKLKEHRWSGNIRELRNVVEAALAMGTLQLDPSDYLQSKDPAIATSSSTETSYRDARARALKRFEMEYLSELIARCKGNASEAARQAKMDRPYLLTLLRKHDLR